MPYPPPTPQELERDREDHRIHREKVRAAFEEWEHPARIESPQLPIVEPALFDDLCDASMEIHDVARRNKTSVEMVCDILDDPEVQARMERVAQVTERRAARIARLGLTAAARTAVRDIQSHLSDGYSMAINPEHPKGYHLRLRAREGATRNIALLLRLCSPLPEGGGQGVGSPLPSSPSPKPPTTPTPPTNVTTDVPPISPTKTTTSPHTSPARSVSPPFNPHTNHGCLPLPEGGGRGVGSFDHRITEAGRIHQPSPASVLLTQAATTNNPTSNLVSNGVSNDVPPTSPTKTSTSPQTTEAKSVSSTPTNITVSAPRKKPCATCSTCKTPCNSRAPPTLQPA